MIAKTGGKFLNLPAHFVYDHGVAPFKGNAVEKTPYKSIKMVRHVIVGAKIDRFHSAADVGV